MQVTRIPIVILVCALAASAAHAQDRTLPPARPDTGPAIREGFYQIGTYNGLIKTYNKPFTADNHDAVNENDYVWTQFIDNQILPVGMSK